MILRRTKLRFWGVTVEKSDFAFPVRYVMKNPVLDKIIDVLSFYCRVEAFPTLLRNIFFSFTFFFFKKPGMYNFLTSALEKMLG